MIEYIKGSCEHCGFAYMGKVELPNIILCPSCGKETYNFDDAETVEENDRTEGYTYDYEESEFKIIKESQI